MMIGRESLCGRRHNTNDIVLLISEIDMISLMCV